MPRGRAWSPSETRRLLALIRGCGEVRLLMASTSRPNEALWRQVSAGLAAAGYGRSVAQCRSKWKALKQAFFSQWEAGRRRPPGSHAPRPPPHCAAVRRIWEAAGRPVFGERRLPEPRKLPSRKNKHPLEAPSPTPTLQEIAPGREDRGCVACTQTLPLAGSPTGCQGPLVPPAGSQPLPVTAREKSSPEDEAEAGQGLPEEQASAPSFQGPSMVSLLQSMQQILVQILRTSQQQQLLLESLASDTVSHLHVISDSLVQVGETLHELLLQSHAGSATGLAHPYSVQDTSQPCSPGISLGCKEEAVLLPASASRPGCLAPP